MRAKLKRIHSPDIDITNFWPEDEENFGFLLQLFVGPDDSEGDEAFGLVVCTPNWLLQQNPGGIVFGANHLLVSHFDLAAVESYVQEYCRRCVGSTWIEVAQRVSRVALSEFQDYQPSA